MDVLSQSLDSHVTRMEHGTSSSSMYRPAAPRTGVATGEQPKQMLQKVVELPLQLVGMAEYAAIMSMFGVLFMLYHMCLFTAVCFEKALKGEKSTTTPFAELFKKYYKGLHWMYEEARRVDTTMPAPPPLLTSPQQLNLLTSRNSGGL